MPYIQCPYCRAFTPPDGDRCGVCGMRYPDCSLPLSDKVSEIRSDFMSSYCPIRVRPERGKTLLFKDARLSDPYYAKVSYGGPGEYMIMDENSLRALIGPMFAPDRDEVMRMDGKKFGKKVSVSYTRKDELIPSLNRRPRRCR